ncbi:CDP-glucose 4,6-dehydratase [Endozoicomonas atrinae]|uniref:CDP-glucose 4,6-dehydratase n=1 Tax=Endozoicomonas atrinae TaxID=1333660 RepID=UPI000825502A|nr:CDP-glucose 4,6-dehydratase [Endozoicomonas atrinae]
MENVGVIENFWHGKKVFLTGHTGFKGSWLSLWLQKLGADVSGYSLPAPTDPSLFAITNVAENMNHQIGDIRDGQKLKKALIDSSPEIVLHLAAQPLVRYSYREPVETYETNVMGTLHLLEAIRSVDTVRACVLVTTDKCYENREWDWGYREIDPMGGYDPYSSSKGCMELLVSSYRNSFFPAEKYQEHRTAIATVRAGNVIGGGDWAEDRLIPDMINAFISSQPAFIRNPGAIRPWQHVLEPLSGYLEIAKKLYESGSEYAEAWNFGPELHDAKPVGWIADELTAHWGNNAKWCTDSNEHPHEANYLKLDCSKAYSRLDWRPRWSLKQTLEKITEWHKAHENGADMHEMTLQQIHQYQLASV